MSGPISRRSWVMGAAALAVPALALCLGAGGFGWPDAATESGRMVLALRACRVAAGFVVGAALAAAGAALQAVLRNALAEPFVLGLSSGGALGAALAMATGLSAVCAFATPLAAFLGAVLTLALVCAIARQAGGYAPDSLVLTGVVVGTVLSSFLMLVITLAQRESVYGTITWWMLGDLQPASWNLLALAAGVAAVALVPLLCLAKTLDALTLGREAAYHLGLPVRVLVPLVLVLSALASAASVALAGIIGFVGLVVPHILRRAGFVSYRQLLPLAMVGGGCFLILCDALARGLLAPREIPVGVVTSLVGGAFFLSLLFRRVSSRRRIYPEPRMAAPAAMPPREGLPSEPVGDAAFALNAVSVSYAETPALQSISLRIGAGECVAVIGPNGAGKSSLIQALTGYLPLEGGTIRVAGRDIRTYPGRDRAETLAVVPQEAPSAELALSAEAFVGLGRLARQSFWGGLTEADQAAIARALELTDTQPLKDRPLGEMSGGERQRLRLAQALAAETPILLLDEPTAHLDLRHQAAWMKLLARLNRERKLTIVMAVHDLTLAASCFPRILLLQGGRIVADGAPREVITEAVLRPVYGCELRVHELPGGGRCVNLYVAATEWR